VSNPVPTTSAGYKISAIREVTPGTTPGTALQQLPFSTFATSGGDVQRVADKTELGSGEVAANIATNLAPAVTAATSALFHRNHDLQWEEVLCNPQTAGWSQAGTNIAAVVTGNILRLTSGTWPGGATVGDLVYVSGFAPPTGGNGNFIAFVTAKSGTDLSLSTSTKTLIAEAAGPSVTVQYVSRFRLGNSLLTSTYQAFHPTGLTGWIARFHSMHSYACKWSHGSSVTVPEVTWAGMGPAASPNLVNITAALGGGNTVTPVTLPLYPMDCNTNFGARLLSGGGGGLYYGGALFPNVRVQDYNVTIARARGTTGAGGTLGDLVTYVDQKFDIKIQLKVPNDCADARALFDAARDPLSLVSLGHAWQSPDGGLEYWLFNALDPSKATRPGLAASGEDVFDLEWMYRTDALHTGFERTVLV
jgi:hypothetical protein